MTGFCLRRWLAADINRRSFLMSLGIVILVLSGRWSLGRSIAPRGSFRSKPKVNWLLHALKLTKKIISSHVPFCSIKRNKLDKKGNKLGGGLQKIIQARRGIHKKIIQARRGFIKN